MTIAADSRHSGRAGAAKRVPESSKRRARLSIGARREAGAYWMPAFAGMISAGACERVGPGTSFRPSERSEARAGIQ
jgi:hypothetical protein